MLVYIISEAFKLLCIGRCTCGYRIHNIMHLYSLTTMLVCACTCMYMVAPMSFTRGDIHVCMGVFVAEATIREVSINSINAHLERPD